MKSTSLESLSRYIPLSSNFFAVWDSATVSPLHSGHPLSRDRITRTWSALPVSRLSACLCHRPLPSSEVPLIKSTFCISLISRVPIPFLLSSGWFDQSSKNTPRASRPGCSGRWSRLTPWPVYSASASAATFPSTPRHWGGSQRVMHHPDVCRRSSILLVRGWSSDHEPHVLCV